MRITLISLLIFMHYISIAQDTLDFINIDKWSYTYFMQNDVKNLNELGKVAIKKNIDYYYLRMRLGIAYYNKKNYIKAIPHFEQAVNFNSADTLALEYLYYCYLFTSNTSEAMKIAKKMTLSKQHQLKTIKPKIIENIILHGAFQQNTTYLKQILETQKLNQFPFKRDINKNFQYYNFGLTHRLTRYLSITHAFTSLISENSLKPNTANSIFYTGYTKQKQYYAVTQFTPFKNFNINIGIHLLKTTTDFVTADFEDSLKIKIKINQSDTNSHLYFYSLNWRHKYFAISLFNGFSNFNSYTQKQFTLTGYVYPLGNKNVYTETSFTLQKSSPPSYFIKQMIGIKIPKLPCWLEIFYSGGNIKNYSEANGYVVYNVTESTLMKTGAGIILPLLKNRCNLTINYSYENRSAALPYTYLLTKFKIPYFASTTTNQTIIGGLTWKL